MFAGDDHSSPASLLCDADWVMNFRVGLNLRNHELSNA
jgi:hypothetical protein